MRRLPAAPSTGGRPLIDGSLGAPVPVAAARGLGARRGVAVDGAGRPHEEMPSRPADPAFPARPILGNARARGQTRQAEHVTTLDLPPLMRKRLDIDAPIEAGEAAPMALAPKPPAG